MEKTAAGTIQVVVIDNAVIERGHIVSMINAAENMRVVGVGEDGMDAIHLSQTLHPDIILMSVMMPKVNGLEATIHIMHEHPIPIVLMSGTQNPVEMNLSFEAQRAGALTTLVIPALSDMDACESFLRTIRLMSEVPLVRRWNKSVVRVPATTGTLPPMNLDRDRTAFTREQLLPIRLVAIAASTGGPSALVSILQSLPSDFPLPILIVQHVSQGFSAGLTEWLNSELQIIVQLSQQGEKPQPGHAYLAPDDYHLELNPEGTIHLHQQLPYRGLRPSASFLFESLAKYFPKHALGIILTGMGDDGAEGMLHLYQAGGLTIAQDRLSCVVYGMPKEAIGLGAVDVVLSPEQITFTLHQLADVLDNSRGSKPENSKTKGGPPDGAGK